MLLDDAGVAEALFEAGLADWVITTVLPGEMLVTTVAGPVDVPVPGVEELDADDDDDDDVPEELSPPALVR